MDKQEIEEALKKAETLKKKLYNTKTISLPNNGGDVFHTQEVMRYINGIEDLLNALSQPKENNGVGVLKKPNGEDYIFSRKVSFDEVEDFFDKELYEADLKKYHESLKLQSSMVSINYFAPISSDWLIEKYEGLREPDEKRDKEYSPLHDSIMSAISSNLKEYAPNSFSEAWTGSMFPERLTKEILRLVEQQFLKIKDSDSVEFTEWMYKEGYIRHYDNLYYYQDVGNGNPKLIQELYKIFKPQ